MLFAYERPLCAPKATLSSLLGRSRRIRRYNTVLAMGRRGGRFGGGRYARLSWFRRVGSQRYVSIIDQAIVIDASHPVLCQGSKNPARRFVYFFDISTSSEGLAEKADDLAAIL
jgi:hypothetical protein